MIMKIKRAISLPVGALAAVGALWCVVKGFFGAEELRYSSDRRGDEIFLIVIATAAVFLIFECYRSLKYFVKGR
jgi:hypothetical protein